MGYTAHELADLSAVSVRTLHYYEEQGLLRPERRDNGYRDYGPADVRRLQQILLFRRADMPLARIGQLLDAPADVRLAALRDQLDHLRAQHQQLAGLIATVEAMVRETEGDAPAPLALDGPDAPAPHPSSPNERTPHMTSTANASTDTARFAALKQQAIRENEQRYGAEARARYGNDAVDATNRKVEAMTQEEWDGAQTLSETIARLLATIAAADAPEELVLGATGRELCAAHKAWLLHYWQPDMYSPDAHRGLAQMYVADERFTATYEAMAPDGARILCDAIETWADQLA